MILFCNKDLRTALAQKYRAEEVYCISQMDLSMLSGKRKQPLLIALSNAQITSVSELCSKAGCSNVSVLVTDNGYPASEPIRIDVSKPRLDYLETGISRVCNLHCRGCSAFIQLADDEPPFYDPDAYLRDLKQLKTKFWGVEKIRLVGGEPLLTKDIAVYAAHSRAVFPDADIRIVTNGLLIPALPHDVLNRLKQLGCSFDISDYPPTAKRKKTIVSSLKDAEIPFEFSLPIRCFFKFIKAQPSDDPNPVFDSCIFSHTHAMNQGGILSPCSFSYSIRRYNRCFGSHYDETDCVDLYRTDKDGWQILKWMHNPHPFCCSCTAGTAPFFWRGGVHKETAAEADWIVPKSIWTDQVLPLGQRLVKPSAILLRSFMQRNKS